MSLFEAFSKDCAAKGKCCVRTDVSSDRKKGEISVFMKSYGHVKVAERLFFCTPFKADVTLYSTEHAVIKNRATG